MKLMFNSNYIKGAEGIFIFVTLITVLIIILTIILDIKEIKKKIEPRHLKNVDLEKTTLINKDEIEKR